MENRLRELIEVRLGKMLDGQVQPHMIAQKLTGALEANIRYVAGKYEVPDQYWVILNPSILETLLGQYQTLATELANQLVVLIRESKFHTVQVPVVRLVADPTLNSHQIHVKAEFGTIQRERTQTMDAVEDAPVSEFPLDAHLLLEDGTQRFLIEPVVNIGRHADNHVVVNSSVVSRRHCQLRLRFGRYYVYDLQSRSGTRVNGHEIQEHRLSSGDVISFGNTQFIYIEDENPDRKLAGDTQVPKDE